MERSYKSRAWLCPGEPQAPFCILDKRFLGVTSTGFSPCSLNWSVRLFFCREQRFQPAGTGSRRLAFSARLQEAHYNQAVGSSRV